MFDRQHMSHSHHREAPIKSTLSFPNIEAALPPGIPAGRRSSSRPSVRLIPELATIGQFRGRMDGAHGGIVRSPSFFGNNRKTMPRIVFPAVGKTIGMQSEAGLPRIILAVYPRLSGEEGATDRDSFRRTGRTCMSTRSPFARPRIGTACTANASTESKSP